MSTNKKYTSHHKSPAIKAVIYCRVSTKEQVEEGSSLIVQEKACRAHAAKLGYAEKEILVFVEEGESAKTANRPELLKILAYCQQNEKFVETLIIYKVDRLARNTHDHTNIRVVLNKLKIRLESATEPIKDDPMGRLMENSLAGWSQFDNEVRAERTKASQVEGINTGRWQWKAPLGYTNIRYNKKGNIEPYEPVAKHIHKAFDLLAAGYSEVEVWHTVTKDGLRNRNGIPITFKFFSKMVRRPVYAGIMESQGLKVKGTYPFIGIVTEERFYEVLDRLTNKKKAMPKYQTINPDFPLRKLLRCECGAKYTASWAKGRNDRYPLYRCRGCEATNINRTIIHHDFKMLIQSYEYTDDLAELLKIALQHTWEQRTISNTRRAEVIVKELEKLKAERKTYAIKNGSGLLPDDLFTELIEDIGAKVKDLETEQRKLEKTSEDITSIIDYGLRFMQTLDLRWEKADLSAKLRFQNFFFPSGLVRNKDGKFGTASPLLLIQLKKTFGEQKSLLAAPRGVEPLLPH